jgi:hypothetical protein
MSRLEEDKLIELPTLFKHIKRIHHQPNFCLTSRNEGLCRMIEDGLNMGQKKTGVASLSRKDTCGGALLPLPQQVHLHRHARAPFWAPAAHVLRERNWIPGTITKVYNDVDLFWQNDALNIILSHIYKKTFFVLLSRPFRPNSTSKLAKSAKRTPNNCPAKIRYGYHKTQNLMPSLNPLKNMQKSFPTKVVGWKLLYTVIKN